MKMKTLHRIAAGVLFLQVAYVVVGGILLSLFVEDTSEIDNTDPPAAGGVFYLLLVAAVIGVLFVGALLLATPGKFDRVPQWLKRVILGGVFLVEGVIIVGVVRNIITNSFGPDEFLNVVMIILSGIAAFVSANEVFRRGAEVVRSGA
ncbi:MULTISPECIES: hypothetical protein [unclassified Streptomyces]|uniref:hypothetical protein n=1 Tax=unclassified Streptomyces TaxID=2593676 RepID=UPI001E3E2C98|nr:hypothetical protein [Streptomyces sp. CB02980]MCB8908397.1 hypothetical protein [Streptomyces sp. CB02980]